MTRCPLEPQPDFRWRRQGLPGSWGTPVRACPALRPRRDLGARPIRRSGVAFRVLRTSAPAMQSFRGSITRPARSLSTLRSGGYPTPRKTRFRWVAYPFRTGFSPAGLLTPFHAKLRLTIPGDQAFLAHQEPSAPLLRQTLEPVEHKGLKVITQVRFVRWHPCPSTSTATPIGRFSESAESRARGTGVW